MKRFIVLVALMFAVSAKADQTTGQPAQIDPMVPVTDAPSDHNSANAGANERAAAMGEHDGEKADAAAHGEHAAHREHGAGHGESAEHGGSHGAHGGHHGAPTVNWWKWDPNAPPVGWFTVNFIIFVYLIVKFAKKPLAAAMLNRHTTIKTTIEENQATYDTIKGKHDSYRNKLANVEQESRELIESTKQDGALERDRIVKNAEEYATRLKDDTKTVILHEEQRAAQRLQSDVAKARLANAEEMMRRGITDADRERLFEQSLKEIESAEESRTTRRTPRGPTAVGGEA